MLQTSRRLRICHVITRMIIGGAQENTLLTVRGLMEKGHEVVLLTGPTRGPEGKLLSTMSVPGLHLIEEPRLIRELNPVADWLSYRALRRYFEREAFDVVHTHSSKAGIIGRVAARRAGCGVVVHTVHGQAFHPYQCWWRNAIYRYAERFAARRCDHIFAVAAAMVDQCVEAGIAPRSKYSVVYSGMEISSFVEAGRDERLRAELGIPADSPVIGKIARLFELKGHEYLLAVAPAIVREFPKVRFLLVGDGNLRSHLEAEVAARGLTENFVFAGLVSPAEISRYVSIMDMLVHLSLREGLPRTVVQALAGGIPAVAFALDGTPEVLRHGESGFVCAPKDTAVVQAHLLELLRQPELARQMGARGREFVRVRFDWRRMVDELEACYYALLGGDVQR
jgi:glycosyltransferase involved in cell wall biosynthesis